MTAYSNGDGLGEVLDGWHRASTGVPVDWLAIRVRLVALVDQLEAVEDEDPAVLIVLRPARHLLGVVDAASAGDLELAGEILDGYGRQARAAFDELRDRVCSSDEGL